MVEKCIIVGAGHAAAQLAPSLRQEGWQGDILIIGDEPSVPYHRPPLSKALLAGEKTLDDILIRPRAAYEKHNIHFRLDTRVEAIDRARKRLLLQNGERLDYHKLALCTGARVRKIPLPGSNLAGVHYLRNARDVAAIQADIRPGGKAVIVGGGYIGLETAAVLNKAGMQVTVIEMLERVLQRVTAQEVSAFYTRIHNEEGVTIVTNRSLSAIEGGLRAERVVDSQGNVFNADLIIIGVGIVPNVELAEAAGLTVGNGIWVDECARTEDPDIVAAGDCTNHPNPLLGCRLRLESVPNATDQAKSAAAAICGKARPYAAHPWFWSDQYDLKLQIAGLNQGYDQVVLRGDSRRGRGFVAWYFKAGKLLAADCINRPREFMIARQLLARGVAPEPAQLADETLDLKTLV